LRIHTSLLSADEVTDVRRIRVTTVPRTLLDLAAVIPANQVEWAVNEAEVLRLTDPLSLGDLVGRYPGRRGIRAVRAALANLTAGGHLTRSELESRFLELVRRTRLPRPETNADLFVGGRRFECDCVWHDEGLVVELDGRAAHATAAAFERDRARDRALQVAGWRVVRVTWRQLRDEPEALATDLRYMLARR
jgi:very-short-patch-repair endonuclease